MCSAEHPRMKVAGSGAKVAQWPMSGDCALETAAPGLPSPCVATPGLLRGGYRWVGASGAALLSVGRRSAPGAWRAGSASLPLSREDGHGGFRVTRVLQSAALGKDSPPRIDGVTMFAAVLTRPSKTFRVRSGFKLQVPLHHRKIRPSSTQRSLKPSSHTVSGAGSIQDNVGFQLDLDGCHHGHWCCSRHIVALDYIITTCFKMAAEQVTSLPRSC
ncbi:hypothetical protein Bbelb_338540 [Branchiostoma belcheri]|nr:hypothetical protein Bbelb_338540 [Branchiostoma belcheri]